MKGLPIRTKLDHLSMDIPLSELIPSASSLKSFFEDMMKLNMVEGGVRYTLAWDVDDNGHVLAPKSHKIHS